MSTGTTNPPPPPTAQNIADGGVFAYLASWLPSWSGAGGEDEGSESTFTGPLAPVLREFHHSERRQALLTECETGLVVSSRVIARLRQMMAWYDADRLKMTRAQRVAAVERLFECLYANKEWVASQHSVQQTARRKLLELIDGRDQEFRFRFYYRQLFPNEPDPWCQSKY